MAQSLINLPTEMVFAECRAFVFFYDIQQNRWSEVGEPNVYSRIQLLCSRSLGSTRFYDTQYTILGRLETTGMITINIQLTGTIGYMVADTTWHNIRVQGGLYYGLRFSPESDGMKCAVIVQNTVQSLQGSRNLPQNHTGNWGLAPEPPPMNPMSTAPVGTPRTPDPPSQDGASAQRRREYDSKIDALCLTLSDAIRNGSQEKAIELVKQVTVQKLPLSIKLKNPVFVTMDAGLDSINIRVVVEDKETSGGAFSMKVSPTATIERLQQEMDAYGLNGLNDSAYSSLDKGLQKSGQKDKMRSIMRKEMDKAGVRDPQVLDKSYWIKRVGELSIQLQQSSEYWAQKVRDLTAQMDNEET